MLACASLLRSDRTVRAARLSIAVQVAAARAAGIRGATRRGLGVQARHRGDRLPPLASRLLPVGLALQLRVLAVYASRLPAASTLYSLLSRHARPALPVELFVAFARIRRPLVLRTLRTLQTLRTL